VWGGCKNLRAVSLDKEEPRRQFLRSLFDPHQESLNQEHPPLGFIADSSALAKMRCQGQGHPTKRPPSVEFLPLHVGLASGELPC
jgi:hypothetical protein